MKAVSAILILQFYRRNALFFGVIIALLAVVMRPAYLIFTQPVVLSILSHTGIFYGVGSLLVVYLLKCIWESRLAFSQPENHFLFTLRTLPYGRLFRVLSIQLLGVSAPATVYVLTLMGYGIIHAPQKAAILGTAWVLLHGIGTFMIAQALFSYPEKLYRFPISKWIESKWQQSWTYLELSCLLTRFRKPAFFHKVAVAGLVLGTMQYHLLHPFSSKGLRLTLWSFACFQSLLAYRMRQAGDRPLFIMKSLPVKTQTRWAAYMLSGFLLFLPESLLAATLSPTLTDLSIIGSYLWVATASFCLGIAILYYQAPPLDTYLGWTFGLFCVGFFAILFNAPLWILGLGIFAFATWIFWEEFASSDCRMPE